MHASSEVGHGPMDAQAAHQPNAHERAALMSASNQAGAYIESIAKTDLGAFTVDEWSTLMGVVITAFHKHLNAAYADDPPF